MKKLNLEKRKAIQPFLEKNVDEKRKAISPLIETILLIVVAVAIIAIIVSWGRGFTQDSLTETRSIADLRASDSTHFILSSSYRNNNLTFTFNPPANLKNQEIIVDRYTILGSTDIYDLNTPHTLREGVNIVPDLNMDMFTIVDRRIDFFLVTTNDEYITLRNTDFFGFAGCPTCPDCEECIPFTFEGNVSLDDVKTGSTFYSDSNILQTGTGTRYLSPLSSIISAGYYDANNLTTIDSNLTENNIVEGVNIFGVVGTASTGPETIVPLNLPYVYYPPGQENTVLYIHPTDRSENAIWSTAVSYCDTLDSLGYDDWYLPDTAQMAAIWLACPNQIKSNTCMNNNIQNKITGWSNLVSSNYWTKTDYSSSSAYTFTMNSGDIYYANKSSFYFVRCVRDH